MKKMIVWGMSLLFFACSASKVEKIAVDKTIKSKEEKNIIIEAKRYNLLPEKEKGTGELRIGKKELQLLQKPFKTDKEYTVEPLLLEKNITDIKNILIDKNFKKRYDEQALTRFVYQGDKAIAIFYSDNEHGDDKASGSAYCIGGSKYLFYLKDNIVKERYLDGFSGEIAPVFPAK